MKSILDKSFAYVPAAKHSTADDFRARMRERIKQAEKDRAEQESIRKEADAKVKPIIKAKRTA